MEIHYSFVRLKEEKLLEIKDNGEIVLVFLNKQARIEKNPRDLWMEKHGSEINAVFKERL